MKGLFVLGRILLGINFLLFGWLHFADPTTDVVGVVRGMIVSSFWYYIVGILWFFLGISFIFDFWNRFTGVLSGIILILILVMYVVPQPWSLMNYIHLSYLLGLIGGCFMIGSHPYARIKK